MIVEKNKYLSKQLVVISYEAKWKLIKYLFFLFFSFFSFEENRETEGSKLLTSKFGLHNLEMNS